MVARSRPRQRGRPQLALCVALIALQVLPDGVRAEEHRPVLVTHTLQTLHEISRRPKSLRSLSLHDELRAMLGNNVEGLRVTDRLMRTYHEAKSGGAREREQLLSAAKREYEHLQLTALRDDGLGAPEARRAGGAKTALGSSRPGSTSDEVELRNILERLVDEHTE